MGKLNNLNKDKQGRLGINPGNLASNLYTILLLGKCHDFPRQIRKTYCESPFFLDDWPGNQMLPSSFL